MQPYIISWILRENKTTHLMLIYLNEINIMDNSCQL